MEYKEKIEWNLKIYGEKDPFNFSEVEEEVKKSMEKIIELENEEEESE